MASELQSDIRDFLKAFCKWVFVTTAGRRGKYQMAPTGFPDIQAMTLRGRLLFIEVKRPKEPVSEIQQEFIDWHQQRGHFAMVARSLDEVEEALKIWGVLK